PRIPLPHRHLHDDLRARPARGAWPWRPLHLRRRGAGDGLDALSRRRAARRAPAPSEAARLSRARDPRRSREAARGRLRHCCRAGRRARCGCRGAAAWLHPYLHRGLARRHRSGIDAMANVAVIGAQWGHEGKRKVVAWLASRADIVVRFQGGHNAGHTLVVGNQTYKLSLLPSGLVRGKIGIIGNGVVVDPEALLSEIGRVRGQGIDVNPSSLRIAENATLILPIHPPLDRARETARGERRIGTTGRGIGPAYEDKAARRAIRVADLAEPQTLADKLDELLLHHNTLLQGLGAATFSKEQVLARLLSLAPQVLPFAEPVWER